MRGSEQASHHLVTWFSLPAALPPGSVHGAAHFQSGWVAEAATQGTGRRVATGGRSTGHEGTETVKT